MAMSAFAQVINMQLVLGVCLGLIPIFLVYRDSRQGLEGFQSLLLVSLASSCGPIFEAVAVFQIKITPVCNRPG